MATAKVTFSNGKTAVLTGNTREEVEAEIARIEASLTGEGEYKPDLSSATPNIRKELGLFGTAASRLFTGPGQVVTAAAEAVGIPGANTAEYTAAVNEIERKLQGGEPLNDKEKGILNVMNAGVGMAVPAGGVQKGATAAAKVLPAMSQGAKAGVIGGSTVFNPEANTAQEGLTAPVVGGLTGGAFGLGMGVYPAGRNMLFSEFRKEAVPEAAARNTEIAQSPLTRDLPISNAQRTGRKEAQDQEARVAGSVAKDFYNKQLNAFADRIKMLRSETATPAELARSASKAIAGTEVRMQTRASQAYERGVNEALREAQGDLADNFGIKSSNVFKTVSEEGDYVTKLSAVLDEAPRKYRDELSEILARIEQQDGALGMQDLIRLHQVGTKLRSGIYQLQKGKDISDTQRSAARLGKRLIDAVEQDVDNMSARLAQARQMPVVPGTPDEALNMGRGYESAWKKFEDTRAEYRTFVEARDALEWSGFSQLFRQPPKDAGDAWRKFLAMPRAEQVQAAKMMREHTPQALEELKRWRLNDVSERMFDMTKAGAESPVSVENFINEVMEGDRIAGNMLFSEADQKNLRAGVAYLRMIQNKAAIKAQSPDPEGMIMALASRSAAFGARAAYRILGSRRAEDLFFTSEGIDALRKIATTTDPNKASYQAALAWLTAEAAAGDAPETEESAVAP